MSMLLIEVVAVPERPVRHPRRAASGPPSEVLDVVTHCPLPSLLLAVPTGQILATSSLAERLLCTDGDAVVGKSFKDFTADPQTGMLDRVASGLLDGYEARSRIRRGDRSVPMTVWIRALNGGREHRFALVKLLPDPSTLGEVLERPEGMTAKAVVGSADTHLVIERISTDVAELLGLRPTNVVGLSLFQLFGGPDVVRLLKALAWSTDSGLGSGLRVRAQLFGQQACSCQLLLLPTHPAPSLTFALLDEESADALASATGMQRTLWQFHDIVRSATASKIAATLSPAAALGSLSSRELEIALRLLNGDRVPAIARTLFLSPSTVRNHLASVFRKLGVSSQQELIHLLRGTDTMSSTP